LATISRSGSRIYRLYFLSCKGDRQWQDRSFRSSTSLHFEVCAVFWPSSVHFPTPLHARLSRGRFRTDGRTDDQTMAAGASVTVRPFLGYMG
jgi:hypothetical protein